jgi:hypothetical protein
LPRRIKSAVMKTIRPCVNFRIGDHHSLLGNYRAVQERNSRFRASDRRPGSYPETGVVRVGDHPPGIYLADDQKSLVLLFDPEARLLFGSIQAKVMTAIVTRLDLSMV